MKNYWINILCMILSSDISLATIVHYVQDSVNDVDSSTIAAVSSDEYLETAIEYSTVTAPADYSRYKFIYWSNSSYPAEYYRDVWGRSLNPITFILLEDTTTTAHYLPATVDTDSDGVPDWFEREYYNTLTNSAASDTDGDGITLAQEYSGGTHPLYSNSSEEGGVFWADSGLVTVNLGGFAKYTLISDPAGTVNQSEIVETGTVIISPDLAGNNSFGYWELDGVRQVDAWGAAYSQISFVVNTNDRLGVAYLFTGDSDSDGVPDAYEQYYYGTLSNGVASDSDGDGISLLAEYNNGTSPLYANSNQSGGVFYEDSALITVNLAGFAGYTLRSEPEGVVDISETVPAGTEVTTPDMQQSYFGFWTLDGIRQQDAWGIAKRQFSFVVGGTNREGIAYLFDKDSDGDGVNDGFEYFYYNSLTNNADSDTDGDGIPLLNDDQPLYGNTNSEGGVSWDDSDMVTVDLQSFSRELTINPTNRLHSQGAATGQLINVSWIRAWTAVENIPWLEIISGSNGLANGIIEYSITANNGTSARNGTISIGGKGVTNYFTVTQIPAWYPSGDATVTNRTPEFRWKVVSGATWYQIWIGRNGKKYLSKWINATTWTPPSDMKYGDYSWWLRAWGPSIGMQPWSDKQEFTIPANPPNKATLLTPSGAQSDRTPLFDWDTNNQATWQQIWINKNGKKYYAKWLHQTATEWTPFWNIENGEYEWWLRGWNVDGFSSWSDGKAFDYGKVIMNSPLAGATVGATGSLEWQDAPSGNADWYQVWLGRNGKQYSNKWYRRSEVLNGTVLQLDYNLPAGAYSWWLRGWSADYGMGPWVGRNFTVAP